MPPLFESPRENKNTIFAKRKHIAPIDKKRNLNKLLGSEDFLTEDAKEYDELIQSNIQNFLNTNHSAFDLRQDSQNSSNLQKKRFFN